LSRTEPGFPPYVFLGATDRELAPVSSTPTLEGASRVPDQAPCTHLTDRYNLTWIEVPELPSTPAGGSHVILCPLPFWRLGETLDLLAVLDGDAGVRAPVHLELLMGQDAVGYWRSRCPEIPTDPIAHYLKESEEVGYPALDLPEPDPSAGDQAVVIQRARYALAVTCVEGDLERVARQLAEAGFLGMYDVRAFPRTGYPDAAQWQALAGPAGLDTSRASGLLTDRHSPPSRQVFLPRPCSEAATEAKLVRRDSTPGAMRAAARHAREKVVDITRRAHAAMEQLRSPLRRPTPPAARPSKPSRLIH
jgi:hypothetical protein